MKKILLTISVILLSLGTILFLAIGTPIRNFTCMWAGLGIFLCGVIAFIGFIFYRGYCIRKEKEQKDVRRGGNIK